MSEKFSQPNFLVSRSSGNIDVMVPTGHTSEVTRLDSDGQLTDTRLHEMREQNPVELESSEYRTRMIAEVAMTPDAQMALGEQLAGVEPMSDLERQERRHYVGARLAGVALSSEVGVVSNVPQASSAEMIEGIPGHLLPSGYQRPTVMSNEDRRKPVKVDGIPSSALYAPGSPYDPDRAEKDALAKLYRENNKE